MNGPFQIDPEERVFTFQDIRTLFRSQKKRLLRIALVSASILLCGQSLFREAQYKIEATFRDEGEHREEGGLKSLLLGMGNIATQSETISLMKSRRVVGPLVQRLGLQASVPPSFWGHCLKFFHRVQDNWKAEIGRWVEDLDPFVFEQVTYAGHKPLSFWLRFTDAEHFSICDRHSKKSLVKGVVGKPLSWSGVTLTLLSHPQNLQFGSFYPLRIRPWMTTTDRLRKQIRIASQKINQAVYEIKTYQRDRKQGLQIVNGLMAEYQAYLKQTYETLAAEQLSYLGRRQEDICKQMGHVFDEYTDYMRRHVADSGFFESDAEASSFLVPYQAMGKRLFEIELALANLAEMDREEILSFPQEGVLAHSFENLAQEYNSLRQKRDLLDLSLRKNSLTACRNESASVSLPFAFNLEGISLETAAELFTAYNTKLDEAEAKIRLYHQVQEELTQPDVALASLASILVDPLSKELIAKASETTLHLKDEKNRTSKEGLRWEEDLKLQRQILATHLDQMTKVEENNSLLMREKMATLQQVQLDGVQKRLSVLHDTVRDTIQEKKEQLAQEKRVLEGTMAEFRLAGAKMPDKWRQEKWLKLKTDMGIKMMEGLTEVVEAKTISHHLHRFEAQPLDIATSPVAPAPPFLLLTALLGSLGVSGGVFGTVLVRTLLKGFPASFEKLRALRFPLLGSISFLCDGPAIDPATGSDLETLRQTALFLTAPPQGQVIALLAGKGPDYSFALAEHLSRISLRSIILRCDFERPFTDAEVPGLLQIGQGELSELPIRSRRGVDWITAGGITPYGVEVMQSTALQQLLAALKKNYAFVFLLSRGASLQAPSFSLLRYADKAIVTVCGESTEELTPFMRWAYHGEYVRLQFMTSL